MWMSKGLCGSELKKQTVAIGIFTAVMASFAVILGFMIIDNPEKFLSGSDADTLMDTVNEEIAEEERILANETVATGEMVTMINDDGSMGKESIGAAKDDLDKSEEAQYELRIIKAVQKEGVEFVIGGLITIAFSLLLIYGARSSKSVWFLPWLVQECLEVFLAIGFFIIYLIAGANYPFYQTFFFFVVTVFNIFMIYAVLSHYIIVRRMKRHTDDIINSVMDGSSYNTSGVNYERLQDEVARHEGGVTYVSTEQPSRSPAHQAQAPPERFSTNPFDEPDDRDRTNRGDINYFSI